MTTAPFPPSSFGVAGDLESLREGDLIRVKSPDGGSRLLRITGVEPTPDADALWPGAVTLTAETVSEPVPAAPYPDLIPPNDQDRADACRPAVPGGQVPARLLPAANAPGDRRDD